MVEGLVIGGTGYRIMNGRRPWILTSAIVPNPPDTADGIYTYIDFFVFGLETELLHLYFTHNITHYGFLFNNNLRANAMYWRGNLFGRLTYHADILGPDSRPGVYEFTFLSPARPGHDDVARINEVLAANMHMVDNNLVYRPSTPAQRDLYESQQAAYDGSRVNVLADWDPLEDVDFLPFNLGEGYGFLRLMSLEERPNPHDIVIYESLPNELPKVSGIITTVPQTPLAHVNLRAVQDGIPNAFIRHAFDDSDIADLIGDFVHYTVTGEGYSIRAATRAEVDAHLAASRPAEVQTLQRDFTVTEITDLDDIGFDDWDVFGVKAANLAVLRTLGFPEGTVPDGFAVPFYFYDEFMKHNGFYDDIEEMLADPDFRSDYDTQQADLKDLRKKIKKGTSPQWMIEALEEMHATYPEGKSLRYRSSTNNEDLPGFSGAGLYDSKTQKPDETEEDGIDKSLKQVFASMWNFRAFTEREFHNIDHSTVAMGVLVHPNYKDELANGVAASFNPIVGGVEGYYVNTQVGEDMVTNPEALSVPEEILLHEIGKYARDYEVIATSNLVDPGELLMSDAQMAQLRRHLEEIHDRFQTLYDPAPGEPFAIEIEFKITSENILAIKQARPWVFSHNSAPMGAPSIAGTPEVRQTLTAHTDAIEDRDGLDGVSYSYQWLRNDGTKDTDIADATGDSYELTDLDEGKTIKVRVSFTDNGGRDETVTSAPTVAVAPALNIPATGEPTISGTVQVGRTLTADTSGIKDDDGLGSPDFSYQWLADDTEILGATGSTYTLAADDEGRAIKVQVNFTDDWNNEETLTSAATAAVEEPMWSADMLVVELTSVSIGATSPDHFSNIGGVPGLQITSLWSFIPARELRLTFEEPVAYAEDMTLQVGGLSLAFSAASSGDGSFMWADVDVDWEDGQTISVRIVPTGEVEATAQNTLATGAPTISGKTQVGEMLTADTSGIDDDDGLENAAFSYQWTRSDGGVDTNIQDATGSSYTLVKGDEGKTIKVTVSFTDAEGNLETLTSDPTGEVEAKPNTRATGAPTIDGMARVDETLAADTSGIDDDDGLTNVVFSYQWLADDAEVAGATGAAYTLVADDEGKAIKVKVSFTDERGNEETLTSDPTGAVAPDPGPLTVFTLVDASTDPDTLLGTLEDGDTLTLADPDNDSYGIRVDTDSSHDGHDDIRKVELAVSGAKDTGKTEWEPPYSLYGDSGEENLTGEDLPAGSYDLTATAYKQNGDVLGTLKVSFSVAYADPAEEQPPAQNTLATGAPAIDGIARVGETLTADTSGIDDDDGLTNALFSYQWTRSDGGFDTNITGATGATYTLVKADEGRTIKVTVSFTDAQGNSETLTSDPTGTVEAKPNTQATGLPTIDGIARVGETLTADTSGIDDDDGLDNATFSYQWVRSDGSGDANIQDSTESSHTLTGDDEGKTIKVRVSFTDAEGNSETLTSDPTGAVEAKPNTQATGAPTIGGEARVGQMLMADTSDIDDDDGLTNVAFAYQWVRSDGSDYTEIEGATWSTYTLVPDDEGKIIKVTVSFTDAEGNAESLTSDPTGAVEAKPNTQATGAPTIGGEARVGQMLMADTSDIDDDDGLDNAAFAYQWLREDAEIAGATGDTYTLVEADEGQTIKVTVSFTDDRGHDETLTSAPTGAVEAKPNTWATGAPTIDGEARVGETLTADTSGIDDDDGLDTAVFSYQWLRGEAEIAGATGDTYTLVEADEGQTIKVKVSFTDGRGHAESLTSDPTGAVAAAETVPGRPQDLEGNASAQGIALTWKAPAGSSVTHYVVYRGELENGSMNGRAMTEHATIEATGAATAYTDTSVEAGQEYRYRVAAVNSAGEGKKSSWLDIAAGDSPP